MRPIAFRASSLLDSTLQSNPQAAQVVLLARAHALPVRGSAIVVARQMKQAVKDVQGHFRPCGVAEAPGRLPGHVGTDDDLSSEQAFAGVVESKREHVGGLIVPQEPAVQPSHDAVVNQSNADLCGPNALPFEHGAHQPAKADRIRPETAPGIGDRDGQAHGRAETTWTPLFLKVLRHQQLD